MAIELDDGTIVRSLPEQVSYNDERIEETQTKLTALEAQVAAALAGVFHYKGSVATYGDLPATGNEVGDVWNVLDTGKNYAWSGSSWDDLGGIVDLSNLVTLDTAQTITGEKTFNNNVKIGTNGVNLYDRSGELAIADSYGDYLVIGQNTNCQTNFIPHADNNYDLGSSTYKWKDLDVYTIKLGSSGVLTYDNGDFTINGNITPNITESYDIGTSTLKYKNGYFSNNVIAYNGIKTGSGGSTVRTIFGDSSGIFPEGNGSYDLGLSVRKWKDGYFSGKLNIGFGNITYNSGFYFNADIFPLSNGAYNLGKNGNRFKDIYLSGNLSDSTNSVTIADLAALIAYAKAQGWIS